MSGLFLWTGLFFILALNSVLGIVGLSGGNVVVVIGAVSMAVGCLMLWNERPRQP